MTKEEAIRVLEDNRPSIIFEDKDAQKRMAELCQAIDMATEALENKPTPCEKCIHVKSCRKVIILKNRTYKLIKYCSQGVERRNP